MRASVVITTKNRRDELCVAISSALTQSVQPEVLVIDDGSTDGTADMVRAEFPAIRLECSANSLGLIVQRNRASRLVSGEIIFSLDDDAEFSTPFVVEQTLRDFDHPRIGAVAVPYVEPKKVNRLMQSPPDTSGTWITDSFIGTAHALRRDLFLALGGYRDHLVHQGEESDFCIRMLDAGYLVRLGRSNPIKHWDSPKRDLRRMDFYGSRNAIQFVWQNVPAPLLIPHLLVTTWRCIAHTCVASRLRTRVVGIIEGYRLCFSGKAERKPVKFKTYLTHRKLKFYKSILLSEVNDAVTRGKPVPSNISGG